MKIKDEYPFERRTARQMALDNAKELRRDPTLAERILWNALRGRQLGGLKFRRQYPVDQYILDFCCPSCKLAIEVDGGIHSLQEEYDNQRTELLQMRGFRVIRFRNEEVLENLPNVLQSILESAKG